MGQQNQKQQNPLEEGKNGSNSIVKETAHRRLPLEMECEIFKCLKPKIQQKLIWGMGRGIYGMFRQKVLTKSMRVQNPKANRWTSANVKISGNGLKASTRAMPFKYYVFAEKGFSISPEHCRKDNFPGTLLYYYEVTKMKSSYWSLCVGLMNGNGNMIPRGSLVGHFPNSYGAPSDHNFLWLHGQKYAWPTEAMRRAKWKGKGDVVGCGLLLNPDNKLSIFFSLNGILIGIEAIQTSVNVLYPTVNIAVDSIMTNFGDDPSKPFKFEFRNVLESQWT